jgi:YfiH family protein
VRKDWIAPGWTAPPNIHAFTTTRYGGASTGVWSGFNLGNRCGDDAGHVAQNRADLSAELPAPPQWLHQVHGTRVVTLPAESMAEPEADAAVAFEPGRVCAVLTADCLPVFFCNRRGNRAGVAHAGWRGLAGGVLQATVEALEEDPAELLAWLGPAIGPTAYEVGIELTRAFPAEYPAGFVRHGDRLLLDLYALARLKLTQAGVVHIGGGAFCTFTESDRFFSFRRDGVTGRMASLIWMD